MKRLLNVVSATTLILSASAVIMAEPGYARGPIEIPLLEQPESELKSHWKKIPDVAQYGDGDWSKVIGKVENVTVEQAKKIADNDPRITFFFHMKGWQMVLGDPRDPRKSYRVFHYGDAVFFGGEPWWGSAVGYADGYIKE